jgi:hypothetical protein
MKLDPIVGVATAVVVLGGVALAFSVIGSPAHERALALDSKRVVDLRALSYRIDQEYDESGQRLPAVAPDGEIRDPVTAKPYEYRRLGARHYELCANFALASEKVEARPETATWDWPHRAGRMCYRLGTNSNASPSMQ